MELKYKGNGIGGGEIPRGVIWMWYGEEIPEGWTLCDGQNGTPDLRDRFILGSGTRAVGDTGGEEEVTLTTAQMPTHNHTIRGTSGSGAGSANLPMYTTGSQINLTGLSCANTGSSSPHNNMPPYFVLKFIMKL